MDLNIISNERYYLEKLSKGLNFSLSTSLLFLLSWFESIAILLMELAAAFFGIFMLYVFLRTKKYIWLITFLIFVVLPLIVFVILALKDSSLSFFVFIPLIFFYFYCFVLKLILADQLEELRAKDELRVKIEYEKEEGL